MGLFNLFKKKSNEKQKEIKYMDEKTMAEKKVNKMNCYKCGARMLIDKEGVIIVGGEINFNIMLKCYNCIISRQEFIMDIDTELNEEEIAILDINNFYSQLLTKNIEDLLRSSPSTASYTRFKESSGNPFTIFIMHEDYKHTNILSKNSSIKIKSKLFNASNIGLVVVILKVENELYETWWNWHNPLHKKCFEDMINQENIIINFYVEKSELEKTFNINNSLRDMFKSYSNQLNKLNPWGMKDFDNARNVLYNKYPSVQDLWNNL